MLINEVGSRVGLTRKTIRYYENEGLLNPKRNLNNSYREYSENDIETLKRIKFLRELNVPINNIKKVISKEISLTACLNEQIIKIDNEIKDYIKIRDMCSAIIKEELDIFSLDLALYFTEMNILNKKGVTMRDIKPKHKSAILGAVLSTIIFSGPLIFIQALLTYFVIKNRSEFPLIVFGIISILILTFIFGMIYNLIKRIKEIKGGEEDEASKY